MGVKIFNMTINDRIRKIRNDLKMNQTDFAAKLGISQTGVSYLERQGTHINDSTIKTICSIFQVSETWLRTGEEPMYIESEFFNLNDLLQKAHATKLEIEILKTYFDIDSSIRLQILEHFRKNFTPKDSKYNQCPAEAEQLERKYLIHDDEDTQAI